VSGKGRAPERFALGGRPHVELGALLKAAGAFASGGEAKHAVQAGLVRVNGAVETRRGRKLVAGDVVAVKGRSWEVAA
jgi:ribosome-associated protein